ncbi:hypothetical protein KR093_008974 [Drosophila rubida]|uniref:Uncharacterized protein n=1 Tax=Drosophila rubida TaxID=30044 RepID=A0AAD4K2K1_9MUSC|nr:hypothetical protein KR093_008974 [Drosophila rubida]
MPRRRRPRCKVKPLIALRQEATGDSDAGSQDDQLESKSDDLDAAPIAVAAHTAYSAASAALPDWEYKHFPELHNQLPSLPTFADVFGQHSEVIYQEHAPVDYAESSSSTDAQTSLAIGEDLTTFGLDLASQGDIYVHFNGPFTQQPASRSSANCALELGMRGMRDAMDKYPTRPPTWDPFVPETRDLGLLLPVPVPNSSRFAQQSREKSA